MDIGSILRDQAWGGIGGIIAVITFIALTLPRLFRLLNLSKILSTQRVALLCLVTLVSALHNVGVLLLGQVLGIFSVTMSTGEISIVALCMVALCMGAMTTLASTAIEVAAIMIGISVFRKLQMASFEQFLVYVLLINTAVLLLFFFAFALWSPGRQDFLFLVRIEIITALSLPLIVGVPAIAKHLLALAQL